MKKKRIMHIVQSPGGVERYITMLLKNMDLTKYENILVCSFDYKKEKFKGLVSAFEYVDLCRSIVLHKDFIAGYKIRKLIKKYSPDVVYMHSSKAGAIGRFANLGIENISFYNPHGWAFNMDNGRLKKTIYSFIEKLLAECCTKIIAISEFEKKSALINKITKDSKIKVIFNGIDIQEYYAKKPSYTLTKKKLGIPEDAYVFGTVGRLTKQKAPDIFIRFAKIAKKEIPRAFFILVGDGDEQAEIEATIIEEGLKDSVIITGWVEDPMEYIQLFDQAFLLSRWEGFGLVLAEYMIAEKPLIATNVNAIPDLIENGLNGILIPPNDPNAVYHAAVALYNDEEYRKKLIRNEIKIVRSRFDVKRVARETEELIEVSCGSTIKDN